VCTLREPRSAQTQSIQSSISCTRPVRMPKALRTCHGGNRNDAVGVGADDNSHWSLQHPGEPNRRLGDHLNM
jgi:hypothetical protein